MGVFNTNHGNDTHYFINGWNNDQKTPKYYANPNNVGNSEAYAIYGMWWKDSRNIIWYRDGVEAAKVTLPYDFNEDMYMFFDMEAFTWGPGVASNDDLNNPNKNLAYYDYVKTYELVDAPLSVADANLKTFKMYPNPVNDVLYLKELDIDLPVVIYDYMGRKLIETKSTNNEAIINVNNLQSGAYFVKVKGYKVRRLIVK